VTRLIFTSADNQAGKDGASENQAGIDGASENQAGIDGRSVSDFSASRGEMKL